MLKRTTRLAALGLVALAAAPASADVPALELSPVRAAHLFVPIGFDDNDHVVVVLDGYLPDPCHKLRQPNVTVDASKRKVTVMPMAAMKRGHCPDVTVPFHQVVHVGPLASGDYTVELWDGSLKEALPVKVAPTPRPDDYLYAPIDEAQVLRIAGGKAQALLRGRFTDTCLKMKEVRVIDSGKAIEILPIMERKTPAPPQGCQRRDVPFESRAALPPKASGRYLLHVRSLDGQSVNVVHSR